MKVFQSQPRMLGRTWMSLAALLLPMSTNALQFTNHCEREIRPEDRELFEVVADLMDRYRHAVEDHINRTIISGNLDNYTVIDEATMDDWRGAVDDMLDGTIKLACEYDTTDRCANDDDLFGWRTKFFRARFMSASRTCVISRRSSRVRPWHCWRAPCRMNSCIPWTVF